MIEATFLHIPGVGRVTECRLWRAGFHSWDLLWRALQAGRLPRELLHNGGQRELFPVHDEHPSDTKALAWVDCLDQSRAALRNKRYQYFLELLKPGDHWRLLGSVLREALYLDIETTGLSKDLHYVTVVGALFEGTFYQWVWPESVAELAEMVKSAPLVVTFNGRRFDVPFLMEKAPTIPPPKAHVDLLYIARAAGFRGTQKQLEESLGLTRDESVRGLGGAEAVASWCSALYGDRESYEQLLRYNRADVEMMPLIGSELCTILNRHTPHMPRSETRLLPTVAGTIGRQPCSFNDLQNTWRDRRPTVRFLNPRIEKRFGRTPMVVGIDLRGNPTNPTGWAVCQGERVETRVIYADDEILRLTLAARPDLVSIDAPLFLPRGRHSVSDDSACRKAGGIVRDAERILWARGIGVYPALIRQMQGLTRRGIDLTRILTTHGIRVIESYPGAAQDILNIPRRKHDESLLRQGLTQFGYELTGPMTHDELDAVTSALVGQFYLADHFEAIGADDEGYMIIPKWSAMTWAAENTPRRRRIVSMIGLPGAGKTTLTRGLAQRLAWRGFVLGDELRSCAKKNPALKESLERGEMAPESLVYDLVRHAVRSTTEPGLLLDSFPRLATQIEVAEEIFSDWSVIFLDTDPAIARKRLADRVHCGRCGFVIPRGPVEEEVCPLCGELEWQARTEDKSATAVRRLQESNRQIRELLSHLEDAKIIRLDASAPPTVVADEAVARLLSTQLK